MKPSGPTSPFGPATLLGSALRRVTAYIAALALVGNAVLLVLGWLWLYVPDSHTWQFLFSVLLGLALIAGFLLLSIRVIQGLYVSAEEAASTRLTRRCLTLAFWVALGALLQRSAGLLSSNVETRAGFWNSQLSPHHRALFTYDRLISWQNLAIHTLIWIVVPAVVLPFLIETQARHDRPWSTALRVLGRPQLWGTVALTYTAGSWMADRLLAWHPAHSTTGEVVSAMLRTLLVYGLAVALLLFTLAVVAQLLAREHARRNPVP